MASGRDWDVEKILNLYIHDYMAKKEWHSVAEAFAEVANVPGNPVVIDTPHGFLIEWWSVFWDMFCSRMLKHPEAMENFSAKPIQMMENALQNMCQTVINPDMNQQRAVQFPMGMNLDKMPELSEASLSASKSLLQQQTSQKAQQQMARDKSNGFNLGRTSRMDSTLSGVPKIMSPRAGLHDARSEKGANPLLLKGWPLTGVGQFPPSRSFPVLNSLLPGSNQHQQFQTATSHHQQNLLSHEIAKTPVNQISYFQGSTNNSGNLMLPTNDISGTDGQVMVPTRQTVEQTMTVPVGQIPEQQQKDLPTQQQPNEVGRRCRKRKNLSNSQQPEENALGNMVAEVEKPSSDDIDSFLSHGDDNGDNLNTSFGDLQQSSTPCGIKDQNGFSFEEFGSNYSSKDKILCCHFSSDGKIVAGGHGKKVLLWRTSTFDYVDTAEGHSNVITDVRFKPSSNIFATSSFDKTVQIWDANKPSNSLYKLLGHAEQVTSVDFHPTMVDVLSSCDGKDEIRLWNINQRATTCIFKGATQQVRFQPRMGNLLAAASGNRINLFDVETNSLHGCLEGHVKQVRSLCWDTSGRYMASVSEDSARVWSVVSGGQCVHQLPSNGNKFESCTFHPGYSLLLLIGSYQSLDLWNPTDRKGKIMTVANAHSGIISALADCPENEMMASASHDRGVKLWR